MSNLCAAMGRKLTRARRQRKLSLNEVAAELCISKNHLKALESGRLDQLPGSVYALGFIRNYADFVELDANELIAMARGCMDADEAAKRPHMPEPHRESRFPTRLVLFAASSAMLMFFTAWPILSGQDGSQASIVPLLPAHLAARLEEATGSALDMALHENRDPQSSEIPLEIRATQDTWVVIKDEQDQTLLSGIIRSGDSFVPGPSTLLKLTASDGGNLVLYVHGRPVSELGEPGRKLRSIKLDVAGLIRGTS